MPCESILRTIWKESATSASECTEYPGKLLASASETVRLLWACIPTINSNKKNPESIPSRIMILFDFERPMVDAGELLARYLLGMRSNRLFPRSLRTFSRGGKTFVQCVRIRNHADNLSIKRCTSVRYSRMIDRGL